MNSNLFELQQGAEQFRNGAKAMFDALLMRAANNWHARPEARAVCDAENKLIEEWAAEALEDVSPDDHTAWKSIGKAYAEGYERGRRETPTPQPSDAPQQGAVLTSREAMAVVMDADASRSDRFRGTSNWAAHIARAVERAVLDKLATQQPQPARARGYGSLWPNEAQEADGSTERYWQAGSTDEGMRNLERADTEGGATDIETTPPAPKAAPVQAQGADVTMTDALAAGDGGLQAAIDYWQDRALKAEKRLPAGSHLCAFNPGCSSRCDVCPEDSLPGDPHATE